MKRAFEVTTRATVERAYLVGVSLPDSPVAREHKHLDELALLTETAAEPSIRGSVREPRRRWPRCARRFCLPASAGSARR